MATMYDLLQGLRVGDGLLIPSRRDLKSRQETFWALRLTTNEIEWQKTNAADLHIRHRARLSRGVGVDGKTEVLVGAVLMSFGHDPLHPRHIFRCLVNEHDPSIGHRLEALTTQDEICIALIGDSGRVEDTMLAENALRPFAQKALSMISRIPPWSQADFYKAGNAFKQQYPNRTALWNSLAGKKL